MYVTEQYISSVISESDIQTPCEGNGVIPICEQVQFIQEGFGSFFTKVGELLKRYAPKDPEFLKMKERLEREYTFCKEKHREKQRKTEISLFDFTTKFSWEGYKKRPEYETCILLAEYRYSKNVIDLIKKKKYSLCDKNVNTEKCKQWIDKNLPLMEEELNFIKSILDSTGKAGGLKHMNIKALLK
jgi:hypothetical protein